MKKIGYLVSMCFILGVGILGVPDPAMAETATFEQADKPYPIEVQFHTQYVKDFGGVTGLDCSVVSSTIPKYGISISCNYIAYCNFNPADCGDTGGGGYTNKGGVKPPGRQ